MRVERSGIAACIVCGFQCSELQSGAGTGIEGLETLRRRNFERLLTRIETRRPLRGAKLLEVGCTKGWFLEAASRRGAECFGIEPEEANAVVARDAGFTVESAFFPGTAAVHGPFDLIVFNDVLEHIPSPDKVMKTTASLLAPGGLAVVNLPSSDGVLYRIASLAARVGQDELYWRLWQRGFASPHISYFNPANLRMMTQRHTALQEVDTFRLKTVSRDGLRERVHSSHSGIAGDIVFSGVWALSFVLDYLPPDIHVAIFENTANCSAADPSPQCVDSVDFDPRPDLHPGIHGSNSPRIEKGSHRGA
ncbi:MAG: class I SAM-dependent methyltransferase [Pseudomonadota bacterium]